MGTSALSSEMSMGRRPIAKSGLFSLVPIEEVRLQGGCLFGWRRSPFPFVAVVYRNVSLKKGEVACFFDPVLSWVRDLTFKSVPRLGKL